MTVSLASQEFLERLRSWAAPLTIVDPFLRWGLDAYPHLWDLAAGEDLIDGASLAFQPGDDPVESPAGMAAELRRYLKRATEVVPGLVGEVPGDPGRDAAERVYACIRHVVAVLDDFDDADLDELPARAPVRPAGIRRLAVVSVTAWFDPVTLEVVDLEGPSVSVRLDAAAADDLAAYASAAFSLADRHERDGPVPSAVEVLLRLQMAGATASPGAAGPAAEEMMGVVDRIDDLTLARIGFALADLAAGPALGGLDGETCRSLADAITAADTAVTGGRLGVRAAEAASVLRREVVAEAEKAGVPEFVNVPDHETDALSRARRAAFHAAVAARRGEKARLAWRQAQRQWEPLDPRAAAVCAERAEAATGPALRPLSFDAALVVTEIAP